MTWDALFERAGTRAGGVTVENIGAALAARRRGNGPTPAAGDAQDPAGGESGARDGDDGLAADEAAAEPTGEESVEHREDRPRAPDPARVVADADVLAADLLVGGDARDALDLVRAHDWVDLVASDALLADAAAVIAVLADEALAGAWRERIDRLRLPVAQPPGDHPGLASAAAGGAAHLLTVDESLSSVGANLSLQAHLPVSIRTPHAFTALFDPARLYPTVVGGAYPGPDTDPHA